MRTIKIGPERYIRTEQISKVEYEDDASLPTERAEGEMWVMQRTPPDPQLIIKLKDSEVITLRGAEAQRAWEEFNSAARTSNRCQ